MKAPEPKQEPKPAAIAPPINEAQELEFEQIAKSVPVEAKEVKVK